MVKLGLFVSEQWLLKPYVRILKLLDLEDLKM